MIYSVILLHITPLIYNNAEYCSGEIWEVMEFVSRLAIRKMVGIGNV